MKRAHRASIYIFGLGLAFSLYVPVSSAAAEESNPYTVYNKKYEDLISPAFVGGDCKAAYEHSIEAVSELAEASLATDVAAGDRDLWQSMVCAGMANLAVKCGCSEVHEAYDRFASQGLACEPQTLVLPEDARACGPEPEVVPKPEVAPKLEVVPEIDNTEGLQYVEPATPPAKKPRLRAAAISTGVFSLTLLLSTIPQYAVVAMKEFDTDCIDGYDGYGSYCRVFKAASVANFPHGSEDHMCSDAARQSSTSLDGACSQQNGVIAGVYTTLALGSALGVSAIVLGVLHLRNRRGNERRRVDSALSIVPGPKRSWTVNAALRF